MTDKILNNRRILVVEDDYLLAQDLHETLLSAGAEVAGPVPSVAAAMACLDEGDTLDAAMLDVNLRGELIFPVADKLRERGIPFILATGYDDWTFPERFADTPCLEKPLRPHKVTAALAAVLLP